MSEERRLPPAREHLVCAVCPSLVLPFGGFDVAAKPSADSVYDRSRGFRADAAGTPVCVHPDRVGLPADRYASCGVPLPGCGSPTEPPPLPEGAGGLEAWLVDYLRAASPDLFEQALQLAMERAQEQFPGEAVTEACRRALGSGLLV